jgi:Tfp pilus assembly protein PilV
MYSSKVWQRQSNVERLRTRGYRMRTTNLSNKSNVTTSVRKNRSFRRGVTLVEVVISIVVMIISLLGISTAYVSARRHIIRQRYYQSAVHLASQKIEEMKAAGYSAIKVDEDDEVEELSLFGLEYYRHTKVEPTAEPTASVPNPCKKVIVAVQWAGEVEDRHEVKLVTYIGP